MNETDKQHVSDILDALYKGAGLNGWRGEVNEAVAQVAAVMICEVRRCSKAMDFVPRPPSGMPQATLSWLLSQVGKAALHRLESGSYRICQVGTIYKLGRLINEAQTFNEVLGLPPCE